MEYINEGYSFAIILVLICIFYSFNFISVTSYSRDGQNAKNLKYMPVSFEKQITYKALIGIIMNIILMMIVLIGIKLLISSISVINLLLLFVIATLINFVNNYIGVIIDLKNPKLNWTHEHAVVKQNFNMIIQMALIALQIIAIVYLGNKLQNLEQIVIIVSFVYMSLFVMVKTYIKKSAKKLYSKID
jgi:ABC-2 type transport system permease protein